MSQLLSKSRLISARKLTSITARKLMSITARKLTSDTTPPFALGPYEHSLHLRPVSLTAPSGKTILLSTGLFIKNEFLKSHSSEKLTSIDPATETRICDVEIATWADIYMAVMAARAALNDPLSPEDRAKLMHKLADLIEKNLEELFTLQAWETGKPFTSSMEVEGAHMVGTLRYFAGWADKIYGQTIPVSKDKFVYTLRQPVGICAGILPWNCPLTNSSWMLGPALATGNCIILKPSEHSPLAALYLAKLCKEAGYPPGVIQVLNGYGNQTGEELTKYEGIDKIAFTGSATTGRRIIEVATKNMKKASIETGVRSAFIVFEDADLEQAAKWAIANVLGNSGQICSANSRILVQADAEEKFLEILTEMVRALKIGQPFDRDTRQGPQASKMHYDEVLGYIKNANHHGARLLTGGHPFQGLNGKGYFIQPTIFSGVRPHMKIFQREVFGPVLAVSTFKTEDEAVDLANIPVWEKRDSLAAMIFTENLNTAHRTAAKLQKGMVWINESNNTNYQLPFGASKQSGLGHDLGKAALAEYVEEKMIHVNLGLQL